MKAFMLFPASFLFDISALCYAQIVEPFPVPDVDPLKQLLLLIQNWNAMGPLAISMGLVIFSAQLFKKFAAGFIYTRLVVTVLSVLYGVLLSVQNGMGWLQSALVVVITGGGAVAIYEAWKGLSRTFLRFK